MFKEAICLAKPNIELNAEKTTAMLYTLADKFLDRAELDEIKEVIRMTRLGQMLMDEGMEKGIELNQTDSIKKLMKNMNLTIDTHPVFIRYRIDNSCIVTAKHQMI